MVDRVDGHAELGGDICRRLSIDRDSPKCVSGMIFEFGLYALQRTSPKGALGLGRIVFGQRFGGIGDLRESFQRRSAPLCRGLAAPAPEVVVDLVSCDGPQPRAEAATRSDSRGAWAPNGSGRISQATADRIQKLAEEMGYTPSAVAQSLVTQRTFTIGVVVTTIADPFVVNIVNGIENTAQAAGYSVFLSSSNSDPEREVAVDAER